MVDVITMMIEDLSESLQPYKDLVGSLASYVTILQFFSGMFICLDIYKQKSTKSISALPFVGGIIIGILVLKFAVILQDKNMFNVNVAAIILNSIYVIIYLAYSENKHAEVFMPAVKGSLLVAALLTYTGYEDPQNLEFRYGLIVTILMLLLIGSPLLEVQEIVNKRDASSIPLPMTAMGFITSILWLLYGVILNNSFMIIQNVVGTMLCVLQLMLCLAYPKTKIE